MRVGHFTSHQGRSEFQRRYVEAMALLPEPDALADVNTPFGTVRTFRFGPETTHAPFVIVPGMGSPASVWAPNLAGLAAHRTVYAVDTLGGPGASMQRVPLRNTADQVHWVRAWLDALDLTAVHMVGMSLGGWHALTLAVHAPERLSSVALVDPAQTLDRIPVGTVLRSIGALPVAPAWLRRLFLESIGGGGDEVAADPVARVVETGMRTFSAALPHPAYPTDDQLLGVRVPVLALLGGRSTMLDADRARDRAERLLPDVRVEVWPDATHALPGEYPEATVDRVAEHADAADKAWAAAR